MLLEFREMVRAGILRVTPENEVLSVNPSAHGATAEKQPPEGSRAEDVALLDRQLLEWLERRRQQKREGSPRRDVPRRPGQANEAAVPTGLRQKVVERLAAKILADWDRSDEAADARDSLRDQVAERLADEILRRWQCSVE